MLRIETSLVLLSLLIAFVYPQLGSRWFESVERRFSRLSHRRTLSVALVGLTALALRAAVLPIEPIPEPIVHDEFGYLLAADTFAHGRLTNPTHPMWMHFETFSILQKPTYQCFAQPAQGIILAFGKFVLSHPFWGVWLSVGVMCAAITWMLQGWLPPEWALLGGVLAILRYGTFSYWANSYWGGAGGAIGGALVLGALPRVKESLRVRDATLMGIGLALLASSRPYEGFIFSLPIAFALFAWMLGKSRPPFQISLRRVVMPLALVLAIAAAGMSYYFWRVTGSPLRMPYQIERETYAVAPYMLWQHVRPEPAYRYEVMRKMYIGEELGDYYVFRSATGILLKIYVAWRFFFGVTLTAPLLLLSVALPPNLSWRSIGRSTRFLLFLSAVVAVGSAVATFYNPHYSAPATGLFLTLVSLAMQRVRLWSRAGLFVTRALCVICVLTIVLRAAATPLHIPLSRSALFAWNQQGAESFGRAAIERDLQHRGGNHLVIVRYRPEHEPFKEWVYNDADIDGAKVIWARDIDLEENILVINYFKDRYVWLLEADKNPPKLSVYPKQIPATPKVAGEQGSRSLGIIRPGYADNPNPQIR